MTLVPTNERKEKIRNMKNFGGKFRYLIARITKNTGDFDEKYMKTKFNSDEELPLNKTIEIPNAIIVVRAALYENENIHKFS